MNWIIAFLAGLTLFCVTGSLVAHEFIVSYKEPKPNDDATALVVLLHGYTLDPKSLLHVEKTLMQFEELKGADVLKPNMPLGIFSMADSGQITAELLYAIDKAWKKGTEKSNPYNRIVFVGHSIGGLYARKIYAAACGENPEAPFEKNLKDTLNNLQADSLNSPRPWANSVDRIVLLAGMNRGWSISHHMSISRAIKMRTGVIAGYVLKLINGKAPVIFSIRRGSPFITQLRLQWLAMREHVKEIKDKSVGDALTIQLLGTIDDLVSPEDNIDLISGKDFVYLEVPASGHRSVIDMDETNAGRKRQKSLAYAFDSNSTHFNKVVPADSFLTINRDVKDVVFVIHGIRDEGYWTRKIGRRVQKIGRDGKDGRIIATITSSYGYFPMLSFLHPGSRQKKVEWLMDRYTEARAKYPEANFHYIAHSHGTYLLAKALLDYPSVKFNQVVFAGSVVRQNYQWQKFIPDQVKSVLNFVATADWIVAFFPKALQSIGVQDLGSAGHDGFKLAATLPNVTEPETYIIGGHSAAIQEAMWDSIAEFVITGKFQPLPSTLQSKEQAKWVAYPAKVAPLIWIGIILLLTGILYMLWGLQVREYVKTLIIISYLTLIWIVLTSA